MWCGQIQRNSGLWYSAEYSTFFISDEAGKYRMTVAGYSGDAGNAMMMSAPQHNADGKMFSTIDRDNDECGCNCAADHGGGWWFGWCTAAGLNYDSNAIWANPSIVYDVVTSRMMVKMN